MSREYFICTLLNVMKSKGYISKEKYIFLLKIIWHKNRQLIFELLFKYLNMLYQRRQYMKNKFTYNIFFNDNESTLQDTIEAVLINYIKQIINGNNCNEGNLEV